MKKDNKSQSAVALRLEKARLAKAEKKAKEVAAKEAEEKSKTVIAARTKRRRNDFESRGPLAVPEDMLDPNFQYRMVVDDGSWNMSKKKEMGYEFVDGSNGEFDETDMVIKSEKFGSVVGRPADSKGRKQYLMRMPKDEFLQAKAEEREAKNPNLKAELKDSDIYQKTLDIKDKRI